MDKRKPQLSGLLSLPTGAHLKIRYYTKTLSDHVNFSLTCRTIYALYDSSFWEFACASAGYGMKIARPDQLHKLKNKKDQLWPWAGLARIIVKDRAFFGPYTINENVRDDTVIQSEAEPNALTKPAVLTAAQVGGLDARSRLQVTQLNIYDTGTCVIYARFAMVLTLDGDHVDETPLVDHPFLANRFMIIPPCNELYVHTGSGVPYSPGSEDAVDSPSDELQVAPPRTLVIKNEHGVTVGDIYLKFAEEYARTHSVPCWITVDHDPVAAFVDMAAPPIATSTSMALVLSSSYTSSQSTDIHLCA